MSFFTNKKSHVKEGYAFIVSAEMDSEISYPKIKFLIFSFLGIFVITSFMYFTLILQTGTTDVISRQDYSHERTYSKASDLSEELPPGMLDMNTPYRIYPSVLQNPASDPGWNAFVAEVKRRLLDESGRLSIVERTLPTNVSEKTSKEVFTLYSYIREATPDIEGDISLILACSMIYYAKVTNLPLSLVVGVSQTESKFRPGAISHMNARGVMQVMWKYHWAVLQANGIKEEKMLHDPELGVMAGTIVLSRYLREAQSIPGALERYYGTLSSKYVNSTLSYKHAFELYTSGISENWENSQAREQYYLTRLTGGNSGAKPGENGKIGPSVIVKDGVSLGTGSVSGIQPPARTGTIVQSGKKTTVPFTPTGNSITIVYRDGQKKTWKD